MPHQCRSSTVDDEESQIQSSHDEDSESDGQKTKVEVDFHSENALTIIANLYPKIKLTPIVGILMIPCDNEELNHGKFCIPSSVVRQLKYSGALVRPVWPNQETDYYADVFENINGLYIPGCRISNDPQDQDDFLLCVDEFCKLSMQALMNEGTYWPIWGVGIGLQVILMSAAGKPCLYGRQEKFTGSLQVTTPLMDATDSVFLSQMPNDLLQAMQEKNIAPITYDRLIRILSKKNRDWINEFNVILACKSRIMKDEFGIVMVESVKYPIYGTLVQPELLATIWTADCRLNRSLLATRFAQYNTNFFVAEASRNDNNVNNDSSFSDLIDFYKVNKNKYRPDNTEMYYYFSEEPS